MKDNKLTIMEKLVKEQDNLRVCLEVLCQISDEVPNLSAEHLNILGVAALVLKRNRQVCEKWIKLAYEVAPVGVRTAKAIRDLEKQVEEMDRDFDLKRKYKEENRHSVSGGN